MTQNLTYASEFLIPNSAPNDEFEFYVQSVNEIGPCAKTPVYVKGKAGDKSKCFLCGQSGIVEDLKIAMLEILHPLGILQVESRLVN